MRSCAEKACPVASVTDDDIVDNVFNPRAAWSDHGHKRHIVNQTLLNKAIEQVLI